MGFAGRNPGKDLFPAAAFSSTQPTLSSDRSESQRAATFFRREAAGLANAFLASPLARQTPNIPRQGISAKRSRKIESGDGSRTGDVRHKEI